LFDVVQAFLTSDLDPEDQLLYIYLPPRWKEYCEARGIPFDPTDLILLQKSQYGEVDAAQRCMDKFVEIDTRKGGCELKRSVVDPCVFYKRDSEDELAVLLTIHVDDGYIAGRPEEVRKTLDWIKQEVEILEIGRIDTHLAVNYELKHDQIGWYFECSMAKYVQDAVNQFETQTSTVLSEYSTPAVPGSSLIKLEEGKEVVNMSEYRQHVGRLLYAVTKVIPDCANAIRDLTCHLSTPGEEHWKALTRIMGYLKHHYKPLKMRAPTELRVVAIFDADWATDNKTA